MQIAKTQESLGAQIILLCGSSNDLKRVSLKVKVEDQRRLISVTLRLTKRTVLLAVMVYKKTSNYIGTTLIFRPFFSHQTWNENIYVGA